MKTRQKTRTVTTLIIFTVMVMTCQSWATEKTISFEDGYLIVTENYANYVQKIRLDPPPNKILKSTGGEKYLLSYDNPDIQTAIYNSNGLKIAEAVFAGEIMEISDQSKIITRTIDENNSTIWKILDEYGSIWFQTDDVQIDGMAFLADNNFAIWGESNSHKNIIRVYDENKAMVYEKAFDSYDVEIEKIIPCYTVSKIIVICSKKGHGYNNGSYAENYTISADQIDYRKSLLSSKELGAVNNIREINYASSGDGLFTAGLINDNLLFLIDVDNSRFAFTKTLSTINNDSNVIQIETNSNGDVCILKHFNFNGKDFVLLEVYDKEGKTLKMRLFEQMGHKTRISTDWSNVTIFDGKNTHNCYLH